MLVARSLHVSMYRDRAGLHDYWIIVAHPYRMGEGLASYPGPSHPGYEAREGLVSFLIHVSDIQSRKDSTVHRRAQCSESALLVANL